jgi:hypothetical protein
MSQDQYRGYRLRLVAILSGWALSAIVVVLYWDAAPLIAKGLAIVCLCLVIPDVDSVKRVFTPYSKYREHGFDR